MMNRLVLVIPRLSASLAATILLALPVAGQDTGVELSVENRAPELLNPTEVAAALEANYPPMLLQLRISGEPIVRFEVDATGAAQNAEVEWSGGHPDFATAALSVIEEMRFAPALQGGRPVPTVVRMPFNFAVDVPEEWWGQQGFQQPRLRNGRYISRKMAEWLPARLLDRNETVRVILDLIVDAEGSVWNIKVAYETGYPELEQLAVVLGAFLEFDPATAEDGSPVTTRARFPMVFELRRDGFIPYESPGSP